MALKWFLLKEEDSKYAIDLLHKSTKREISLFAPAIILIEFSNAITKHARYSPSFINEFIKHHETFLGICDKNVLNLIPQDNEIDKIFYLALEEKISYYDAEYLYLSKKLKVDLITYDRTLKKIAN